MQDVVNQKILQLIENKSVAENYVCFDVRIKHSKGPWIIAVTLDYRHGGITLEDCVRMNVLIGEAIEASRLFDHPYVVQVVSPGIDAPLKGARDFERVRGRLIRLARVIDGGRTQEVKGRVQGIQDGAVILDGAQEESRVVPLKEILWAKQDLPSVK